MGLLPERRDISRRPSHDSGWLEWSVRELDYEVAAFRHGLYDTASPPAPGAQPPGTPRHDYSPGVTPTRP